MQQEIKFKKKKDKREGKKKEKDQTGRAGDRHKEEVKDRGMKVNWREGRSPPGTYPEDTGPSLLH